MPSKIIRQISSHLPRRWVLRELRQSHGSRGGLSVAVCERVFLFLHHFIDFLLIAQNNRSQTLIFKVQLLELLDDFIVPRNLTRNLSPSCRN